MVIMQGKIGSQGLGGMPRGIRELVSAYTDPRIRKFPSIYLLIIN